jgi:type IV secretion system protein VirB10
MAVYLYDSGVAFGQERVLVVWQRLIMPNGTSINLEGMPGVDLTISCPILDTKP